MRALWFAVAAAAWLKRRQEDEEISSLQPAHTHTHRNFGVVQSAAQGNMLGCQGVPEV
jgi:hypothetical protein